MRIVMELKMISVKEIRPNPFQPRESFEKESLRELADSIKDAKILQPILVRQHGFNYQIIAGERRWRAAQIAGLHKIPCIVKEIDEERVLIESLIENLHRKDLTDLERENAIHEIWENREDSGFQYKSELAKAIGVSPIRVEDDIEAWEARHEKGMPFSVSTRTIARTRGLEAEVRKGIVEKVAEGDLKASEVDVVAKVIKKASEPVKKELLKPKSRITPKMAETIVAKLPTEKEQKLIVDEINRSRLTEDEVEDRVREVHRAKELGKPLTKEVVVGEGTVYVVGEYDCPHCKKHYLIKCNGKNDWVEQNHRSTKTTKIV
jgi:ParB family chromosome partitioning protein